MKLTINQAVLKILFYTIYSFTNVLYLRIIKIEPASEIVFSNREYILDFKKGIAIK